MKAFVLIALVSVIHCTFILSPSSVVQVDQDSDEGYIKDMLSLEDPQVTILAWDGLEDTDQTVLYFFDNSYPYGMRYMFHIDTNLSCSSNLVEIDSASSSFTEVVHICAPTNSTGVHNLIMLRILLVNTTSASIVQTKLFPANYTRDIIIPTSPRVDQEMMLPLLNARGYGFAIDMTDFSYSIMFNNLSNILDIDPYGSGNYTVVDYFFLSDSFGVFIIHFDRVVDMYDSDTALFTWDALFGASFVSGADTRFRALGSFDTPLFQGYVLYTEWESANNLSIQTYDFRSLTATDDAYMLDSIDSYGWAHRYNSGNFFVLGYDVESNNTVLTQIPEAGGLLNRPAMSTIAVNLTADAFSFDSTSAYVGYWDPLNPAYIFGITRWFFTN